MGEMVIVAIGHSILALKNVDKVEAERIIADDALINRRRWDIENKCIQLFATQQPVAGDLREIVSFMDLITNLERMGDHAKGIAKIVVMHDQKPLLKPLIDIPRMADKACEMIQKSLSAFITQDVAAARAIIQMDNEVDSLYEHIFRELLVFMTEDPKTITRAVYLIWVCHNLERIADRVTNICERIIFLVTGEIVGD
jgi:phosphate transport system protein